MRSTLATDPLPPSKAHLGSESHLARIMPWSFPRVRSERMMNVMVTYDSEYVYLRAQGGFGSSTSPIEQWGVGFKLRHPGGAVSNASLDAFLETVSGAFSTYHALAAVAAGTQTWLTELTAAVVGKDGKYVGGGAQITRRRTYGSPVAGNGAAVHPYPTSLVISLRTTQARGRTSNGRAYWPGLALAVLNTTGTVASATTQSVATAAANLCNAINQAADSILEGNQGLYVMSGLGSGSSAPVIGVRIGNRLDHQESRERKIVETYSSANVTPLAINFEEFADLNAGERFVPRHRD